MKVLRLQSEEDETFQDLGYPSLANDFKRITSFRAIKNEIKDFVDSSLPCDRITGLYTQ
jgi:hypothetical protein